MGLGSECCHGCCCERPAAVRRAVRMEKLREGEHLPRCVCGDALAAEGVGAAELDRATLGAADVHAHGAVLLAATDGARAPRALLHLGLLPETVWRACAESKMLRLGQLAFLRLLSAPGKVSGADPRQMSRLKPRLPAVQALFSTKRSAALGPAAPRRGSTLGLLEPGRGALHRCIAPLHGGQRGARRRAHAAALHRDASRVAETTVKSAAGWCRETVRDERGGGKPATGLRGLRLLTLRRGADTAHTQMGRPTYEAPTREYTHKHTQTRFTHRTAHRLRIVRAYDIYEKRRKHPLIRSSPP